MDGGGVTSPLQVVAALDSFKGSVTSVQANEAARRGVLRAAPDARVAVVPVADGGEGTLEALASVGDAGSVETFDLHGRPIVAPHVVLADGAAVVESASALGLDLLTSRDPAGASRAHSAGLGRQIAAIARSGAPRVLVGLGGTGCSDGGTGLMLALGARMWDAAGAEITLDSPHPLLARPVRVELPVTPCELVALADVDSPLLGPTGAARMFGPQKGADAALVARLETAMEGWATALAEAGADVAGVPGSGAAGGLGAAVLALGGAIEPGLARLLDESGASQAFQGADLVLTGEGSIDRQTARGKVPDAIARLAKDGSPGVVVVGLGGRVEEVDSALDAAVPIHAGPVDLATAMRPEVALAAIEDTAARVTSLVIAARR